MSHFLSFEPLIVPVSVLLPVCRLALDETFYHDPLLTLTRSRMTTLQEDQEEEQGEQHKCLVSSQVRASFILRNSSTS